MLRNGAIAAMALLLAASAQAQQEPQPGIAPLTLGSEPYLFDTAEQHGIKVTVLAKGFPRPFAIEFLPGGDLLVTERPGRLRIDDPGSTNGTFLGEQMIEKNKPHELRDGEAVRFGGFNVIVKII